MAPTFNSQSVHILELNSMDNLFWINSVMSSHNCPFFFSTDSQIHNIPLYVLSDREMLTYGMCRLSSGYSKLYFKT